MCGASPLRSRQGGGNQSHRHHSAQARSGPISQLETSDSALRETLAWRPSNPNKSSLKMAAFERPRQAPPPSVHWSLQGVPLGQSKQRKHRLKNTYKKKAEDFSMPFCDVQSRLITKAVLRQLDYFQRAPPMDRINPWYSITKVGPNPPHHYHHQHPPHQAHHYCHNNPPRHHPFPPQHHPPHYHLHPRLARQALEKRRFSRFLPTHSRFLSETPFYSAQHLRQCEKPNSRLGPNQPACMPTNDK